MWLLAGLACTDRVADSGAPVPVTFELGEVQSCAAPVEPGWVDTPVLAPPPGEDLEHHLGGYVAVEDLDGDGYVDVVLGWPNGVWDVWVGGGDGWTPRAADWRETAWVPTLSDVDADGDPDLFVTHLKDPPELLVHEGDAFELSVVDIPDGRRVREVLTLHLDDDGVLDLYAMADTGASNSTEANRSLRTDFAMRATEALSWEVTQDADDGRGFDAMVVDWDLDGDDDVVVADDEGWEWGGNRLLENRDGQLVDVSVETGFYLEVAGMGIDVADVDGDGAVDAYVSAIGASVLMQQVDGVFVNTTRAAGASPIVNEDEMGWGVLIRDLDNDGRPDLLTAQGDLWYADKPGTDVVYDGPIDVLQQGDGVFDMVGPAWGFPVTGSWRSLVTWDHNGDGVLDVLATDVAESPRLFLSRGCSEGGWLMIDAPEGSLVEVEAGGRWYIRRSGHSSSFGASGPRTVHVGLGASDASRVRVTTPDGRVGELQDVEGRRYVTAR